MALNTQFLFPIKSQCKIVTASHQVVTCDTRNLPLGSRVNSIFSYGMGERGVSFVAFSAGDDFISGIK